MNRLKGKNIIVTGAARGMGQSIADDLIQEGGNVLYADLDAGVADVAASAGSRIDGSAAGRAIGMKADVSKREDVKALVEKCVSEFGSLDIMFNNAGVNKPLNFLDVTDENWDFIMKVNAYGVLIGSQEAGRQMIKQGKGGKIINTASIAGRQGYDNIAPYCASKFAVISLTQSAARAFAKDNITVNGFAPGVVNTPLWEKLDLDLMEIGASEKPGQAIAAFSAGILRGRAATAKDIVGTTTYLASADSDYMTGQIIMIDGGMVLL